MVGDIVPACSSTSPCKIVQCAAECQQRFPKRMTPKATIKGRRGACPVCPAWCPALWWCPAPGWHWVVSGVLVVSLPLALSWWAWWDRPRSQPKIDSRWPWRRQHLQQVRRVARTWVDLPFGSPLFAHKQVSKQTSCWWFGLVPTEKQIISSGLNLLPLSGCNQ